MINLDDKANWCLSGGAIGSDLAWGVAAAAVGHGVIHFSFQGHQTLAPPEQVVRLTAEQLASADEPCRRANQTLRRRFPARSQRTTNLLRRDWFQVAPAEACYAISTLGIPLGPTIPLGTVLRHGEVKGGTAWGVQMFIDQHAGATCPCYLFDQQLCHWFQWNGDGWKCIYEPPAPKGIYAGIGARDLLATGKLAISFAMDQPQMNRRVVGA